MAEYELVRQIHNKCPNNQMRDVFFEEVETDSPADYIRSILTGNITELRTIPAANGAVTVWAVCDGLEQEFVFTPI